MPKTNTTIPEKVADSAIVHLELCEDFADWLDARCTAEFGHDYEMMTIDLDRYDEANELRLKLMTELYTYLIPDKR